MGFKVATVLFLSCLILMSSAYPGGAPSISCNNLNPFGHGPSTSNGKPPFNLVITETKYKPGQKIEVALVGQENASFVGFLIQAFPAKEDTNMRKAVGSFDVLPTGDNTLYKMICDKTGVTHTSNSNKTKVTFNWIAPSQHNFGDIVFHFTVVRGNGGQSDYFMDVQSKRLTQFVPESGTFSKDDGCGKTKGCYSNCMTNGICDWFISWQLQSDDTVKFILKSGITSGSDYKYVAMGLSTQHAMAKASVVSCQLHNGTVTVVASSNPGYYNTPLDDSLRNIDQPQGAFTNGVLECTFLRNQTSHNSLVYNLTNPWYLITARGNVAENGNLEKHTGNDRFVAPDKITVVSSLVDLQFVEITSTTIPTPSPSSKPGTFSSDNRCGKTKGCYSNCMANGICDWFISWQRQSDDTVKFILKSGIPSGSDNKYVALGFSTQPAMAKASVVVCHLQNDKVSVVASFNPGYYNTPLDDPLLNIGHPQGSFTNGILECTFFRNQTSDNSLVYNLTNPWYLITARGDVSDNGNLEKHAQKDRFVTTKRIDVVSSIDDLRFGENPSTTLTPSGPSKKFKKDPECGVTKACFSDCDDNLCDTLASWKMVGDKCEFTLKSSFSGGDDKYIALGLSTGGKMYPASVIQCTGQNSVVTSAFSYNPGYSNKPMPDLSKTLIQKENSFENGILSCTFQRNMSYHDTEIFDLHEPWYLIAAKGDVSGGLLQYHGENKFHSKSKVDMTDPKVDISMNTDKSPLIKLHGCLMISAWIVSASIGIAMARYFKPIWPDTQICGVKVWFAIHRSFMILTFILGVSGFIVIFVEIDGYSDIIGHTYQKAHPVLGIIVTALLVINPFMSLLRCGPDDPNRWIFNWAHFSVGMSAHILSAVTIALGMYLPKANVDGETALIVIIVYASWQLVFFCIMSALDRVAKSQKYIATTNKDFERNGSTDTLKSFDESPPEINDKHIGMTSPKQWTMAFHVIILVTVAIYLMYMVIEGKD